MTVFLITFTSVVIAIRAILVGVAFLSLFERKLMGLVHYRVGPSKVSTLWGSFQPFRDAIKLASKQNPTPRSGENMLYVLAPIIMCSIYLATWCIPTVSVCLYNKGYLALLALLSCSALWQATSGWVAHSSYSELGRIRAIAQSVSFEIILSIRVLTYVFLRWWRRRNYGQFHSNSGLIMSVINPPIFFLFLLSLLAERGRRPFDLPEGERELVGGYLVDYGGSLYKLIFLAESLSCLLMAGIISICCFQSSSWIVQGCIVVFVILIRSSFPRAGFRSMMSFVWVVLIPMTVSSMALSMGVL